MTVCWLCRSSSLRFLEGGIELCLVSREGNVLAQLPQEFAIGAREGLFLHARGDQNPDHPCSRLQAAR